MKPEDAVNEVLLAFAVVMQVDLDVGDSMPRSCAREAR